MDLGSIGRTLHRLRKAANLSHEELAANICPPQAVKEIEEGKSYPSVDILEKLGEKMGLKINIFFDVSESTSSTYIEAVQQIIRKYIRNREYKSIGLIVEREMNNPLFQTPFHLQFLKWHEGISIYYNSGNVQQAIDVLWEAIDLTKVDTNVWTEREIEILNSIGVIYYEEQRFHEAYETYYKAYGRLESLPFIKNSQIKIRVLYGLSQTLSEMGKYHESLVYSNRGIDMCIESETMYLLGELNYQSGENYFKIGEEDKGIEFIESSKTVFFIQRNEKFIDLVNNEMALLLKK
ncbi:helix-turn-helix domain-containing protein [Bacillus infantis]|uniref:Helix-turn-helix transcriptional regulator n=1 Tax=Bacillus infantis TaxID=324767 RepID=A0A5D4R9V2_9BACI|nr:helix-turn-helix domain-containing protein [Bacillus infantis]TYS47021.1 helix-turn-helix transcriptional regulator [Bacillus infantis]